MQIKQNRAIHFTDNAGIVRCGVVREFIPVDNGFILEVQIRGTTYVIDNSQVILRPAPRIVA